MFDFNCLKITGIFPTNVTANMRNVTGKIYWPKPLERKLYIEVIYLESPSQIRKFNLYWPDSVKSLLFVFSWRQNFMSKAETFS